MTNIFIANLDWEITSEDLKTTFSAFGPVTYAHVVYEKDTKRSKGFGYVEMEETDHAINAINALNGMEVNGRKLDVKVASPKGNRPAKKIAPEKKNYPKKIFSTDKTTFQKRTFQSTELGQETENSLNRRKRIVN
jgi:RNA recognition motif-containing protein